MLNKFSLLLLTSIALLSCERQPMCDDPNAYNFGSDTDFCYYVPDVLLYYNETTLEALKSDFGLDVFQLNIYDSYDGGANIYGYGGMWIYESTTFDSEDYGVPDDCDDLYLGNVERLHIQEMDIYDKGIYDIYDGIYNPNGLLVDVYVTIKYGTPETGNIEEIIWQGELHFNPEVPCNIIEIEYK